MKKYMLLICGKSTSGKSYSLRNLRDQEGVWFLNTESGNGLPFPNKFKHYTITEPEQIGTGILKAEKNPKVHTIVVDSLTFWFDMLINQRVLKAEDTRGAWNSEYAVKVQELFDGPCKVSTKNLIFTAHIIDEVNEVTMRSETKVGCSGRKLNEKGIEAFFDWIVTCKEADTDDLEGYKTPYLNVSEEEIEDGYKHVFQLRKNRETRGERMRGEPSVFTRERRFIDNDAQMVIDLIRGVDTPKLTAVK